jgi:hypothetical protein
VKFFESPRSIFTHCGPNNTDIHSFRTGFFSIKPDDFFEFTKIYTKDILYRDSISIEYPIRDFMINKADVVDKLDIIWYPANGEIYNL